MDIQRLVLFFVFSFSILLLWEAWQKEARAPVANAPSAQSLPGPAASSGGKATSPAQSAPSLASPAVPSQATVGQGGVRVRVTTDLVTAEVDTLGGTLAEVHLLRHKDSRDKEKNVVLLGPEHRYTARSGFVGTGLPNHNTLYSTSQKELALKPGEDTIELKLEAPGPAGVKVTKTFRFHRGSYVVDVVQRLENTSSVPVAAQAYFELTRDDKSPADDNSMAPTYTGPALYTPQELFKKVSFGDIEKGKTSYEAHADSGWVAMIQHYFVAAFIAPNGVTHKNYTDKLADGLYRIGILVPIPGLSVQPGATSEISASLYAGPQEQSVLESIAPGLDRVVDYGWLRIIAEPLFWVLQVFHRWTGNWGIAIILLTVVIKLIFFPLSAASYRSMAKMRVVAPRLQKIREQYADDRMKQNQAMMELYKTEKINPLGGCLPIAVQIPVFIALYWTLLAAVELRHAPFYGWITDLSLADPWFVLPALMMGSMLIQTKMSPAPPDPVQAKVMMIMPFAFGVMFFFFPAGLVLYWLVNNVLSILQQWQINRMMGGPKAAKA